ncbi:MAG: hypothetical protein PVJ05_13510 [Candidatus Thorarchaeota archaeon]|jgi:hypothetical protein
MINLRLSRLMITIAVWLLLTVVVFGSLIGIAWRSMNVTVDVATETVDVVEDAGEENIAIVDFGGSKFHYDTPAESEENTGFGGSKFHYDTPAEYIGPGQYPIAPGYLLDR